MPEYPLCKNRFYRLCRAVFFWCTALSFSLLAVCSIVVTAYFPEDYTEIPFLSFSAMPWVALGCGACVVVACLDDPINDFLQIDGVEESVLMAVSIGSTDMETDHAE